MSIFTIGERIKIVATFKDSNEDLFDPVGVTFRIKKPNRSVDVFTHPDADIDNISSGVWQLSYLIEDDGNYFVSVASTSVGEETVHQMQFNAKPNLTF